MKVLKYYLYLPSILLALFFLLHHIAISCWRDRRRLLMIKDHGAVDMRSCYISERHLWLQMLLRQVHLHTLHHRRLFPLLLGVYHREWLRSMLLVLDCTLSDNAHRLPLVCIQTIPQVSPSFWVQCASDIGSRSTLLWYVLQWKSHWHDITGNRAMRPLLWTSWFHLISTLHVSAILGEGRLGTSASLVFLAFIWVWSGGVGTHESAAVARPSNTSAMRLATKWPILVELRVQTCLCSLVWIKHLVHEVGVLQTSIILLAIPSWHLGIVLGISVTEDYTSLTMSWYCSASVVCILEALLNWVIDIVSLVTA